MNYQFNNSSSQLNELAYLNDTWHEVASVGMVDTQQLDIRPKVKGATHRNLNYSQNSDPKTALFSKGSKFIDMDRSSSVFTSYLLGSAQFNAYFERISELSGFAEDDGFSLNHTSENDFWKFVQFEPQLREAELVLIDNGNLRAIWQDDKGTHVGLQFLGGGMVQYVIFKHRDSTKPISRVHGRDTFKGIKKQFEAFQLHLLLYRTHERK